MCNETIKSIYSNSLGVWLLMHTGLKLIVIIKMGFEKADKLCKMTT